MITQQARLPFPSERTNKPTRTRAANHSHRPIALKKGNENLKSCKSREDKTQIDKGKGHENGSGERAKITHELKLEDDGRCPYHGNWRSLEEEERILGSSSDEEERKQRGKRVCCDRSLADKYRIHGILRWCRLSNPLDNCHVAGKVFVDPRK